MQYTADAQVLGGLQILQKNRQLLGLNEGLSLVHVVDDESQLSHGGILQRNQRVDVVHSLEQLLKAFTGNKKMLCNFFSWLENSPYIILNVSI